MSARYLVIIALLLFSVNIHAKYYPATLNYKDGSTKSGFAEVPCPDCKDINFKASEKGEKENVKNELLLSLTLQFENTSTTYLCLYKATYSLSGKLKKEKNKSWFAVDYAGKKVSFIYYEVVGHIANSFPGYYYHLYEPGNDYATFFMTEFTGNQHVVGGTKAYKKLITYYFKDICPELAAKVESGEFETKKMDELIEMYKKTCE